MLPITLFCCAGLVSLVGLVGGIEGRGAEKGNSEVGKIVLKCRAEFINVCVPASHNGATFC